MRAQPMNKPQCHYTLEFIFVKIAWIKCGTETWHQELTNISNNKRSIDSTKQHVPGDWWPWILSSVKSEKTEQKTFEGRLLLYKKFSNGSMQYVGSPRTYQCILTRKIHIGTYYKNCALFYFSKYKILFVSLFLYTKYYFVLYLKYSFCKVLCILLKNIFSFFFCIFKIENTF